MHMQAKDKVGGGGVFRVSFLVAFDALGRPNLGCPWGKTIGKFRGLKGGMYPLFITVHVNLCAPFFL